MGVTAQKKIKEVLNLIKSKKEEEGEIILARLFFERWLQKSGGGFQRIEQNITNFQGRE